MILSHSSTSALSSEAKKTAPGRFELQPWYKVVIPIGSRAAIMRVGVTDSSRRTNENMPSRRLHTPISCFWY